MFFELVEPIPVAVRKMIGKKKPHIWYYTKLAIEHMCRLSQGSLRVCIVSRCYLSVDIIVSSCFPLNGLS